jgi:hypothetical protein
MSDIDRNKIIDTVRKLAELANPENGAFPNEIAVASAKMQKLMDEHNIAWGEVLSQGEAKEINFVADQSKGMIGSLKKWHWGLGRTIGRITMTRSYATGGYGTTLRDKKKQTRGFRMCFFGNNQSVETAIELFDHWVVLIDDMAKIYTSEYCKLLKVKYADELEFQNVKDVRHLTGLDEEHPNVWRNSWLEGVIAGINHALNEQEQSRSDSTSTALVLVKDAVDLAYQDFSSDFRKSTAASRSSGNSSARAQGFAVGKSMSLSSAKKRIGG